MPTPLKPKKLVLTAKLKPRPKATPQKKAVETARQKELAKETAKIIRLKNEVAKNFWELGKSLDNVKENQLHTEAGCASFEDYLKKEVKIGRSTAYRLIELARNFSKETAAAFGQEKLLGAIAYAKATPEQDRPLDVTSYEIEVRSPKGTVTIKPFNQATSNDIKKAAARLKRRKRISIERVAVTVREPQVKIGLFRTQARSLIERLHPDARIEFRATGLGADPLVSLQLEGLPVSRLQAALGALAGLAGEVMKS